MMFFTETVSSENGLYYVCRRGTDVVAYFGASMVKYLSGGTVFTLEFPGSRTVVPHGERPTGSTTNYLYGNDASKWKTGVEDCSVLRYPELYPGIDLVYKVQDGNLKYEFVVRPFADPDVIRLDYVDAESIRLEDDAVTATRHGQRMSDSGLEVFQKGGDISVECRFFREEGRYVGFSLDDYDQSLDLIIDPVFLAYSTFLGGSSNDYGYGIAVENGYAYVTGHTDSTGFPVVNASDPTYNGGSDCFVTKLASDGQSLVYSTFLGGSSNEVGHELAVENGYAYVTGYTYSADFPVANAYDATHNGGTDCFVTKLASDGQSLVYSTFLGGSNTDYGYGIAVENGYAYVTGLTISTDFPVVNAYDPTYNGGYDCFVSILADEEDSDSDGLSNWEEDSVYGTDPFCIDSDNDNFLDGYEVAYGSDPLDPMSYPAMPQTWYDAIYDDLDGNATLIQQIKDWLDGNHTAIETLFTYVEGNATLLLDTVDALEGNATELAVVAALATANYDWLDQLNATAIGNFTEIREVMEMLGATVGDADYDGLDDLDELNLGTDLQCIDTDCDNLNDAFEVKIGTNPLDDDSDADSYLDGIEVIAGTDPLDPSDYPGATTTTTTASAPPIDADVLMILLGAAAVTVVIVLIAVAKRR